MEEKPFPVFECPPDKKKNKIRWEGLAEGRDQMSMTCPYNKTVKYHKVA